MIGIVALGTRGDVHPLFLLAFEILQRRPTETIELITHYIHQYSEAIKYLCAVFKERFLVFYVKIDPIQTCMSDTEKFYDIDMFAFYFNNWRKKCTLTLVIGNLFSLQIWLAAEACKVPCIIVHPHIPRSSLRVNIYKILKRMSPAFYNLCFSTETLLGQEWVSFLWPLLSSHYDYLRDSLQLQSPLSRNFLALTKVIVIICASPLLLTRSPSWPSNVFITGSIREFDFSPSLLSDDKYFLSRLSALHSINGQKNLLGTVAIDFGSMTEVLVAHYSLRRLKRILNSLTKMFSFVIIGHNCDNLKNAVMATDDYDNIMDKEFRGSEQDCTSTGANSLPCDFAAKGISDCVQHGIVYMEGDVSHRKLFPHCVCVIHHGGAGTTASCATAGISQVVMPVLEDQYFWAERLHELNLSPAPLPRELLFPEINSLDSVGIDDDCPIFEDCASADPSFISASRTIRPQLPHTIPSSDDDMCEAAAMILREKLLHATNPLHRLQCGCRGRFIRENPAEDGLFNAMKIIEEQLDLYHIAAELDVHAQAAHSEPCDRVADAVTIKSDGTTISSSAMLFVGVEDVSLHSDHEVAGNVRMTPVAMTPVARTPVAITAVDWDDFWVDDEEVYTFASHKKVAPEETEFIFDEIFRKRVYFQHGISLQVGDVVIDAGANVGLFSAFCELQFGEAHALRIISIEPVKENIQLLKENLSCFAPSAIIVEGCVGSGKYTKPATTSATHTPQPANLNDSNIAQDGCVEWYRADGKIAKPLTSSPLLPEFDEPAGKSPDSEELAGKSPESAVDSWRVSASRVTSIVYFPHIPGNSCRRDLLEGNIAGLRTRLNPHLLGNESELIDGSVLLNSLLDKKSMQVDVANTICSRVKRKRGAEEEGVTYRRTSPGADACLARGADIEALMGGETEHHGGRPRDSGVLGDETEHHGGRPRDSGVLGGEAEHHGGRPRDSGVLGGETEHHGGRARDSGVLGGLIEQSCVEVTISEIITNILDRTLWPTPVSHPGSIGRGHCDNEKVQSLGDSHQCSAQIKSAYRIALLKIDVEGSELDALQGIDAEHWERIDQVVIETTCDSLMLSSLLISTELDHHSHTAANLPSLLISSPSLPLHRNDTSEVEIEYRLGIDIADNSSASKGETYGADKNQNVESLITVLKSHGFVVTADSNVWGCTNKGSLMIFARRLL